MMPSECRKTVEDRTRDTIGASPDRHRRKFIVVEDTAGVTSPPPPIKRTGTGYKPGLMLRAKGDGRLYQVQDDGSFRRATPKPASKKDRRKERSRDSR